MNDVNEESKNIVQNLKPAPAKLYKSFPIRVARFLSSTFQTSSERNEPNSSTKTQHIRLITIGPSHYCEKVRWGLDLLDDNPKSPIYYTEDAHPPLFHSFETLKVSNGVSSMTPMIVFDDNSYFYDSNLILKKLCPFLYHQDDEKSCHEIEEYEKYLDQHLGATIRVLIYHHFLGDKKYYPDLSAALSSNSASIEKFLFSKMFSAPNGVVSNVKKGYQVSESNANISLESVRSVFQNASKMLEMNNSNDDSKENYYIFGPKYGFTAADLTLAALGGAIIFPKELANVVPITDEKIPSELLTLRNELRSTTAGKHIINMYKKHRFFTSPKESGTKLVTIKTAERNKFSCCFA